MGLPGWFSGKESACNAEGWINAVSQIPGSGRPPEEGMATHSSILALENLMDRGAWQAAVHHTQLDKTEATQHVQWVHDHKISFKRLILLLIIFSRKFIIFSAYVIFSFYMCVYVYLFSVIDCKLIEKRIMNDSSRCHLKLIAG